MERIPDAPEGYRWQRAAGGMIIAPVPWDWLAYESGDGTVAETRTFPPDFRSEDECNGVFSLNALTNVSPARGMTPSACGAAGVDEIRAMHRVSMDISDTLENGTRLWVLRFRSTLPDVPRIVHRFMVAEDAQDTLRWCTFEASEHLWDQAWRLGEIMLANLLMVQPSPGAEAQG